MNLFRKIYSDIFNDNVYRQDYRDKAVIASTDCEQLRINIMALSKQRSFCDTLRNIIVKYCTIQPSKLDKFNFQGDDTMNKRNFAQETDSPKEMIEIMKQLFDNITEEEIETMLNANIE